MDGSSSPKRVIVSADDYALSPAVSDGIRDLLERGRLSATSCMTASPYWKEQAARLDAGGNYDIGVHLTLTDQTPLTAMPTLAPSGKLPSPGHLLRLCLTGRLPRAEVAAEIAAQLDAFEAEIVRAPDHVDGHHHTHQFPVIRDLVLEAVVARYGDRARHPYIRVCTPLPARWRHPGLAMKAAGIGWFTPPLRLRAQAAGIPVNDGFTGVYDFDTPKPYADIFENFLYGQRDTTIVMCHPGHVDDVLRSLDSLADRREDEYRFFAGDRYPEQMAQAGAAISRFPSS